MNDTNFLRLFSFYRLYLVVTFSSLFFYQAKSSNADFIHLNEISYRITKDESFVFTFSGEIEIAISKDSIHYEDLLILNLNIQSPSSTVIEHLASTRSYPEITGTDNDYFYLHFDFEQFLSNQNDTIIDDYIFAIEILLLTEVHSLISVGGVLDVNNKTSSYLGIDPLKNIEDGYSLQLINGLWEGPTQSTFNNTNDFVTCSFRSSRIDNLSCSPNNLSFDVYYEVLNGGGHYEVYAPDLYNGSPGSDLIGSGSSSPISVTLEVPNPNACLVIELRDALYSDCIESPQLVVNTSCNRCDITYVVNTENDIDDGACSNSHCSLREAINASNTDNNNSTIIFNIPGSGPHNISFDPSNGPNNTGYQIDITDNETIIDATTQPNYYPGIISIRPIIIGNTQYKGRLRFQSNRNIIKGIKFASTQLEIYGDSSIIESNMFVSSDPFITGSSVPSYLNRGIYISPQGIETTIIKNNFGYSQLNEPLGLDIAIENRGDETIINMNNIRYNDIGILRGDLLSGIQLENLSNNSFQCNNIPLYDSDPTSLSIGRFPIIESYKHNILSGTNPFSYYNVDIYLVNDDRCSNNNCQGDSLLATIYTTTNGAWNLQLNYNFKVGDRITAQSNGTYYSSEFSPCYIILPDECYLAEEIKVQKDPCSLEGVSTDLNQFSLSFNLPLSSCYSTLQGPDVWYKLTIPPTGNVLIKSHSEYYEGIYNPAIGVDFKNINLSIEVNRGNCDVLSIANPSCAVLDSLPYTLTLENYTPGEEIFLRIWNTNNTQLNILKSGNLSSLIHLTAHELPSDIDDWEICDESNNLLNGNPTIISERDADAFILEFTADATPADIAAREAEFINEGLNKQDECLCNSIPIQLWGASTPTETEIRRRAAVRKAKVDTTNNNYIFEDLEFQVNTFSAGYQIDPDIDMNPDGRFAISWIDQQRRHNYMRVFNSAGNSIAQEVQIGNSSERQVANRIAMRDNGEIINVWQETKSSQFNIYGRIYDANGSPMTEAFDISGTSAASYSNPEIRNIAKYGVLPDIDIANNGDFIVIWNSGFRVFGQRYDINGARIGSMIVVDTDNYNYSFSNAAVSMNAGGEFIISWDASDSDGLGVYFQKFSTLGSPIGVPLLANTTIIDDQLNSDLHLFDDGSFVVTWQSLEQEGLGLDYGIYAQLFDNSFSKIGSEIQVNNYTDNRQSHPSISGFKDGTFFIAWESFGQDGFAEGIYGQLFSITGINTGPEFKINNLTEPDQTDVSTTTNGGSIFMATWEDGANDGSFKGVFAQMFEMIGEFFETISTTSPSSLLGDELIYPNITYQPINGGLANVRLAVIDTGVDPTNPWISNALWMNQQANDGDNCYINDVNGYDFTNDSATPNDVDGHGTKVNGIITRDFAPGVDLDLMNLKFYENGKGTVFDAICGIYYAVDNGADIINLSWGFEASEFPAILNKALKYASDNDVLIVTSAGNTSKNNDRINKYPANLDIDNMIVVTSYEYKGSTNEKKLANYASYGQSNVDIAARGFVQTPSKGDTLTISAGTSLAAPLVSRTAAIIRGLYPMLTAADIKDCILSTAEPVAHLSDKVLSGGVLDHAAAVACALQKAGDCHQVDLYINQDQTQDTTFKSDAWIQSDAIVDNSSDVSFYAANHINLNAGFEVTSGTIFSADIEDCDPATGILNEVIDPNEGLYLKSGSHKAGKIKVQFYNDGTKPSKLRLQSAGKIIETWQSNSLSKGWYEKIMDVQQLPTGTYDIELENDNLSKTKRLYIDQSSNGTTMR